MRLRPAPVESRRSAPSRPWIAAIVALLLALTWQNFLFQTHWHAPAAQSVEASAGGHPAKPDRQVPADQQPACPICLGLAHATPALPSVAELLEFPLPIAFIISALGIAVLVTPRAIRPWQSRAPPVLLQV